MFLSIIPVVWHSTNFTHVHMTTSNNMPRCHTFLCNYMHALTLHTTTGLLLYIHHLCGWLPCVGASVNARDHRKRTPLHVAAEEGEEELIILLLENKADSNIADLEGNTPLDLAARKLNQSAVNILLELSHSSKKDEAVKKTLEKAMESDTVKDDLVGRKFGQLSPLRYCTSPWINVSRQLFHLLSRSL